MAIAIHISFRDRINNKEEALKYVSVVAASLLWMGLIAMYLYMGYAVARLTKSLETYALLEVKDLKNEPCRFWLEDKTPNGNFFQRHFNLICMVRDVFICVNLLALYRTPTTMLVLLLIMQVAFCFLAIGYPPYRVNWHNRVMQITHCLYLVLDVAFLVNINAKMSAQSRYKLVGFSMIAIVVGIILTNIGVSGYHSMAGAIRKCQKKHTTANKISEIVPEQNVPPQKISKNSLSPIQDRNAIHDNSSSALSPSNIDERKDGQPKPGLANKTAKIIPVTNTLRKRLQLRPGPKQLSKLPNAKNRLNS